MCAASVQNGTDGVVTGAASRVDAPVSNAAKHQIKYWKSWLIISRNAAGDSAASQRLILKGRTIWIVDAHGYGILHRDKVRNVDETYRLISREIDSAFRETTSRNDLLQRVAALTQFPKQL